VLTLAGFEDMGRSPLLLRGRFVRVSLSMFGVTGVLFGGVYRVSALIVRRLRASFLTYRPCDKRQLAALRFIN